VVFTGRGGAGLLGAFVGAYVLSLLPFFVTGRYRLPLVVPMQLLAAGGLVWLDEASRAQRYRPLALTAVALAGLSLGLPAAPSDRWLLLAVVAVGVPALAVAGPGAGSVSEIAEGPQPLDPVTADPRSGVAPR
jgi:hypothetical protein